MMDPRSKIPSIFFEESWISDLNIEISIFNISIWWIQDPRFLENIFRRILDLGSKDINIEFQYFNMVDPRSKISEKKIQESWILGLGSKY